MRKVSAALVGSPAVVAIACGASFGQSASVEGALGRDEVSAIVAESLADAQARTSLLAGADAGVGGHDGGFFISGEGFRLEVSGKMQFRYIANFRDEEDDDDLDTGFQTRRMEIAIEGRVHDRFGFEVEGGFDRDGGDFALKDAYATYDLLDGFEVAWGQFKLPLLAEELISSKRQLAVERSIVNGVFNQGRSQGVMGTYTAERWRVQGALSDGVQADNTDFTSAGEADYALTGRVDFIAAGDADWRRFRDFTSERGQDFAARLGAAANFQQMTLGKGSQTGDPADVDVNSLLYTVDAQLEGNGWNAFGEFVGNWAQARAGGDDADLHDFGLVVQGGYRITEKTELFARYDGIFADDERDLDEDVFSFITAGANHYFAGHAVKASADVVYALQETTELASEFGGFPNSAAGMLGSAEDGEIAIRMQFQLLF